MGKVEAKKSLKELDPQKQRDCHQADVKTGFESSIEDAQSKADVDAVMSKIKEQITAAKEQVTKEKQMQKQKQKQKQKQRQKKQKQKPIRIKNQQVDQNHKRHS